jgi:hypothetical protein
VFPFLGFVRIHTLTLLEKGVRAASLKEDFLSSHKELKVY